MSGHGSKLPRRREAALVALLTSPTVEQAAATIGVSPCTLRRWSRMPDFRAEMAQRCREQMEHRLLLLQRLDTQAIVALGRNLGADAPAGAQVRAARVVFDLGIRAAELLDLETRLAALEAAQQRREGGYTGHSPGGNGQMP